MPQDQLQRAKEVYQDAKEAWRDNHQRMRVDLHFCDPAEPQQWDSEVLTVRKGRVSLTLDRTGQYRMQVVNDARKNKPGMNAMPVDSRGDVAVAQQLDGILRHIEYRSRAQIAYDWSVQGAADCGVGWIRIVPKVVDPATNQQEICIERVIDHLSIVIDGTEPDGSDAMHGFAETVIPKRQFKREFPKASVASWESTDSNWITDNGVLVLEYQYVVETTRNMIVVEMPDGAELTLGEDEYWELAKKIGYKPQFVRNFEAVDRTVKWCVGADPNLTHPADRILTRG